MRLSVKKAIGAAAAVLVTAGLIVTTSWGATAAPSSGYQDANCRPSAAHPYPIVLLHGMTSSAAENWTYHGPRIAQAGYCVFAPDYGAKVVDGIGGVASIEESADEIVDYIDQVLATTGAAKVDLAGHSEGGFLAMYIPKVLQYAPKIAHVVALGPPTKNNTGNLVNGLLPGMLAPDPNNNAWDALNHGPIAQPGVQYTIIGTHNEVFVIPAESQFVREPGVKNIWVQDVCSLDLVGHVGLAFDQNVTQLMINGFGPGPAKPVVCGTGGPLV